MQKNKSIFLSSALASSKNLAAGQATWYFQNPLKFKDAQLGLIEFSFTNWFINISSVLGNNTINYSNDPAVLNKYTITIPDGSYSLAALNDYVTANQQAAQGFIVFSFGANYSTNKVSIAFGNLTGWYVHFTAASPLVLLGFTALQNVPASKTNTAYYVESAPNIAAFNNITSLQVACDLTTDTISNGYAGSVIFQTSPVADVGSTQSDRPQKVTFCTLTDTSISSITIRILDQTGATINMAEDFSTTLIIKYL